MESMERDKELAREYDDRFDIFEDELRQWEESDERKAAYMELRTMTETEFPETKKDREDRERCDRAERLRGEDEKAMILRKVLDEKVKNGVADVPRLLTEEERKRDKFVERPNSIITDLKRIHIRSLRKGALDWNDEEHELFKSRAPEHVKIFHGISKFFVHKKPKDLVMHYYITKQTDHYKNDFKARKRAAKYKVAPFPSKEELAYLKIVTPLDYYAYPENVLICTFCCKNIDGTELKGMPLPTEAYDVWAISPEGNHVICVRCRDEMIKGFKENRCMGRRCTAKKKVVQKKSVPPDFFDLSLRTRAFVLDQCEAPRTAIKFCAACRNYANKIVADINANEPGILEELARYEGQVGWTEEEKEKLIALINASPMLDWDLISEGMHRRPNECRVKYETMNGIKLASLLDVDDDDNGVDVVDEITEIPPPNEKTPATSNRRSGLARSAKKAPKTPRVPRNTTNRRGGAVTRAQAGPKRNNVDFEEIEDIDEETSISGGKSGSKGPSDNDSSPQGQQDPEDDSSGVVDEDDEEMPTVIEPTDEPMSPKTLIEKPVLLSPKVLIQPPSFSVIRSQKPSVVKPPPEIVDLADDSASNSPAPLAIVDDDIQEVPVVPVVRAAPPPVVVMDDDEEKPLEIDLGEEEEEDEEPPVKRPSLSPVPAPAVVAPIQEQESSIPIVAAPEEEAPPISQPPPQQPQQAQPTPVVVAAPQSIPAASPAPPPLAPTIIQPIAQHPTASSTPAPQIHTPTPVRPTAASTPSSVSQGAMDPAALAMYKAQQMQAQQAQQLAALMQYQQQGSLTSGTPFQPAQSVQVQAQNAQVAQAQAAQAQVAQAQQQMVMENLMRLMATGQLGQLGQIGQNPELLRLLLLQMQQQQQQQQQNPLLVLQQAQAAQAQAQALAQQQAEQKAKEAQAQAQQQAQARAAALQARISAANVPMQMPIGINTAYQKSLTPSAEPSTSATPPSHRPRAATTIGNTLVHQPQPDGTALNLHMKQQMAIYTALLEKEKHITLEEARITHYAPSYTADMHKTLINDLNVAKAEWKNNMETCLNRMSMILVNKPGLYTYELDANEMVMMKAITETPEFVARIRQTQKNQEQVEMQKAQQAMQQTMQQNMQAIMQMGRGAQPIGIKHPNQYPGVTLPSTSAAGQKRKMAPSISKRGNASSSASAQASPAGSSTPVGHHQNPIGINPQSVAMIQQQRAAQAIAENEKHQQNLLQHYTAMMQASVMAQQAQLIQSQQAHAQAHAQEQKSKRKSGIESITSMQTAAPNRHVQLAGPSARMRGVSPATSRTSQASTPARSITAGTSGHPTEFSKEMSDVMNQINKPSLHPQIQQAKSCTATPQNAASPASSDDLEIVYDAKAAGQKPASKPVSRPKLTETLDPPKTEIGRRFQALIDSENPRTSQMPDVTTAEEAADCMRRMLNEEKNYCFADKSVQSTVKEWEEANGGGQTTFPYLELYPIVRKKDEARLKRIKEEAEKEKQKAMLAQFDQIPGARSFVQSCFSPEMQAYMQSQQIVNYIQEQKAAGVSDKVIHEQLMPQIAAVFQQHQQQHAKMLQEQAQAQAQAQKAQQAQAQPQQTPQTQPTQSKPADNYEKFQLLRPLPRPIATTSSPFAHFPKPVTSMAPPHSTAIPGPSGLSGVPPQSPQQSPSVAVQTSSPNCVSVPGVQTLSIGAGSSGPRSIGDLSSDDDESNGVVAKNRLPPGKDSKQLLSIIDFRALGLIQCPVFEFDEEKLTNEPISIELYKSNGQTALVYEDLSDSEDY